MYGKILPLAINHLVGSWSAVCKWALSIEYLCHFCLLIECSKIPPKSSSNLFSLAIYEKVSFSLCLMPQHSPLEWLSSCTVRVSLFLYVFFLSRFYIIFGYQRSASEKKSWKSFHLVIILTAAWRLCVRINSGLCNVS